MNIRTRFAPSPTGYLHVGGARTALFSYLFARHHGGEFHLRIEDTDRARSTEASIQAIFDGMQWLGLEHDGEVTYQTENLPRYQACLDALLAQGQAYHCNCSRERLDALRAEQMAQGLKPRYDGRCRDAGLSKGDDTVVRFCNPLEGTVRFDDLIRGPIEVSNSELDDLVLARPDGMPTYNFTVVVDDADMQISHVIRGDDHINNTPRQINLYRALGWPVPAFAHVPMILGDDGARLSKRHGAVSVMQYADDGYLPEAVLNYLVRLGWSHGDQELFSKSEMIDLFDLGHVNRSASAFNTSKLDWINQHYLQQCETARLVELLQARYRAMDIEVAKDQAEEVVALFLERAHTVNELAELGAFLFIGVQDYDEKAAKKTFSEAALEPLQQVQRACARVEDWAAADLHQLIADVVSEMSIGFGKVGMPLRLALSGSAQGPANDAIMRILGQEETVRRIEQAVDWISAQAD